jgi:hypothetical protein
LTREFFKLTDKSTGKFLRLDNSDVIATITSNPDYPVVEIEDFTLVVALRQYLDRILAGERPKHRRHYVPYVSGFSDFEIFRFRETYGVVAPGGDPIVIQSEIQKVFVPEIKRSNGLSGFSQGRTLPPALFKTYASEAFEISPELQNEDVILIPVNRTVDSIATDDLIVIDHVGGERIAQVMLVKELPDTWPLGRLDNFENFDLVIATLKPNRPIYELSDIELDPVDLPKPSYLSRWS